MTSLPDLQLGKAVLTESVQTISKIAIEGVQSRRRFVAQIRD